MFEGDFAYYYYPRYEIGWCLFLTAVALPLVRRARRSAAFH
jgi:hypothetical protein